MSSPSNSQRLNEMPISAVRKLAPYAVEAKKQGAKVFHLNIGDPDVKTPEVMIDVLRNWHMNPIKYAQSPGEPEFIQSLQTYYHKLGHSFLQTKDILVTVGGSEGIVMALFAAANAGDEVLVFEPFYSNYAACAAFAGVTFVAVPTAITNGFHLPSREVIESKITAKTKAILYCSPGNPTGTVYTKEEVEMLVAIAKEKNIFLIADEVYREYIFTDQPHTSLLSYMHEIPEQAIMLDSLSKRYSLCGARLGVFTSLNESLMHGVMKIAQSRLSGGIIDQMVGAKLTEVPQSYIDDVQLEYKKRRDVLYEGLMRIPGVSLAMPEGAFYTMVCLPVENAEDFAIWLLKEYRSPHNETVMVAPGAGFYSTAGEGLNQVRIAYVLNTQDLQKCIEILQHALEKYAQK